MRARLTIATVPLLRSIVAARDVDLSGCGNVTNAALIGLLASAPHLHALSIDGCVKVTDAFVATLRDNNTLAYLSIAELPRVRHIEGLLPRSLVHLQTTSMVPPPALASLPHLQSLIASFNRHVTGDYFAAGVPGSALTTLGKRLAIGRGSAVVFLRFSYERRSVGLCGTR